MAFQLRWPRSRARFVRPSPEDVLKWAIGGVLFFAVIWLMPVDSTCAQQGPPSRSNSAQLDEAARREALASIPFDRLDASSQAKLKSVIDEPTIYRRLPVTVVESDPDMYLFLIRYPEVVVSMWQIMGVTKVRINRTGEFTLDAVDGAGTSGRIELVYGDRDTHLYYSEGAYEGPLFGRLIRGRCVLLLKSDYYKTMDQRVYATNRLDMFVQLENIGAEILAKTLLPLVGKTADQNFVESSRFLSQVSIAAETKPDKLKAVAGRLTNIDPAVRSQFVALIQQIAGGYGSEQGLQFTGVQRQEISDRETPIPTRLPGASEPLPSSSEPDQRGLRLRR